MTPSFPKNNILTLGDEVPSLFTEEALNPHTAPSNLNSEH
jgi:hypothetical protein